MNVILSVVKDRCGPRDSPDLLLRQSDKHLAFVFMSPVRAAEGKRAKTARALFGRFRPRSRKWLEISHFGV